MTTPAPERSFSRRTLALGTVWSVPVVAVAAAAPAYAASGLPTLPVNVMATKSTACATTVTWTGIPGQTYQVEYRRLNQASFTGTITATSATASFSQVFASPNDILEVRVRHYLSPTIFSAWVTYTLPLPPAPTNLTVNRTGVFVRNYAVAWNAVGGASSYHVRWTAQASDTGWTNVATATTATTASFDRWLWESQPAQVQVRALVCGINSPWKTVVLDDDGDGSIQSQPQNRAAEQPAAGSGSAQAESSQTTSSGISEPTSTAGPASEAPVAPEPATSSAPIEPSASSAPEPSVAATSAEVPVEPAASATP